MVKITERVFEYDNFTVRVKDDFVRIDTSMCMEADDYYIDFENVEGVRLVAQYLDEGCPHCGKKFHDTKVDK